MQYVTSESFLPLAVLICSGLEVCSASPKNAHRRIRLIRRPRVFFCTLAVASPPSPPSPMLNVEHGLTAALELKRGILDFFNIGYRGGGGQPC